MEPCGNRGLALALARRAVGEHVRERGGVGGGAAAAARMGVKIMVDPALAAEISRQIGVSLPGMAVAGFAIGLFIVFVGLLMAALNGLELLAYVLARLK